MDDANPGSGGTGLIGHAAAEAALARCAGLLQDLATDTDVNGSGVLHVVVLDPAADAAGPGRVLAERSFGKAVADWDADYAGFARAKAQLSWRLRCDSHAAQALAPQRLRAGDSALWGSVWLDGLVVGVSGCEAPYDEAAAMAVAAMLRAHAKLAMQRHRGTEVGAASG